MEIRKKEHNWYYDSLQAHSLEYDGHYSHYSTLPIWTEIDEDDYWHALEVLPPCAHKNGAFYMSEFFCGDVTAAFVQIGERYFGKYVNYLEFQDEVAKLRNFVRENATTN